MKEQQLDLFDLQESPVIISDQARSEMEAHVNGNVIKVAVDHNHWHHVLRARKQPQRFPWATDHDVAYTIASVGGMAGAW